MNTGDHDSHPESGIETKNREHQELEAIVATVHSILIVTDAQARIQRWNPAAARVFGIEAEHVLGLPLLECGVQWEWSSRQTLMRMLAAVTSPLNDEVSFRSDDGEKHVLGFGVSPLRMGRTENSGILILASDITERQKADTLRRRLMTAVEQVEDTIVITDLDGKIVYANPAFETITGHAPKDVVGKTPRILKSGKHDKEFYEDLWATLERGEVWSGRFTNLKADGTTFEEDATISPVRDKKGAITNYVAVKKDVTEKLALEIQLRTAQKLESIGQLAAGIAHEINTPTQFIGDNTRFLRDSFEELRPLLETCLMLCGEDAQVVDPEETLTKLLEEVRGVGLAFLLDEVPSALRETLSGLDHVSEIVSAMKSFTHPGVKSKQPVDINQTIMTTITLSKNEWKYVTEIETDLDPNLPFVDCLPGEIGQALLNIIINAAHAIAEVPTQGGETHLGKITIATRRVDDSAEIRITDSGCGIPQGILDRVFDPFFTTKEVGRGTGQGLAIARSVVVDKHSGRIDVESTIGQGTVFTVILPIESPRQSKEAA